MPLPKAALLPVALLAAIAAPLHAQDNAHHPQRIKDLAQVEVRATPLPQTAEDLIRPTEVLAGQRLDETKSNSLGETVNRMVGVQSSYFGPGVGRPIIRGMDGARVQVLNNGLTSGDVSTVSVDHAASIEPFLADQIEVLKGTSTLLYGSGAIGGAVNVVDGRIPEAATTSPFEGRAELRAGSVNDERTGMSRLDGTDASGKFVFHADLLHRETGDYDIPGYAESAALRASEHDHDHGEHEAEAMYGLLRNSFVRTDNFALGVSYVGECGFLGVGASLFNTRYGIAAGHSHTHDHAHEDGHDHGHDHGHGERGTDHAVHIDMDQRRYEIRGGLDDLGRFYTLRIKLARTDYQHVEYEGQRIGTVFDNKSNEGRAELVFRDWSGWDGVFGLQLSTRNFDAVGSEAFVPPSNTRDLGMFALGARTFGPTELEFGIRHDRNWLDIDHTQISRPSRDFDATSLSAGLRWNLSDAVHLNLSLDHAQRSPTTEELYSNGMHVATQSYEFGDANLDVETANRAEIGLHWQHRPIKAGIWVYQVDFSDFVYLAPTGIEDGGTSVRVWNQSDARFNGGEAELQWTFLENDQGTWTVRGFGDVVRGKLTGNGTREVAFSLPHGDHSHDYIAELGLSGNLPRIAPWRASGELRWEGAHWRVGAGAVRYARQDAVGQYETPSPDYTLVNANLAWHHDTPGGNALELFVDGNNLLDKEARPHTSFLKDLVPLPGRNISAGVRLLF